MTSVEDYARFAIENLITELNHERNVSEKLRTLTKTLTETLTKNEEEKANLWREIIQLKQSVHELEEENQQLKIEIISKQRASEKKHTSKDTSVVSSTSIVKSDKETMDLSMYVKLFQGDQKEMKDDDTESISTVSSIDMDDPEHFRMISTGIFPSALSLRKQTLNESHRLLITVIKLTRFTFRKYFGLSFSQRWSCFIDEYMSKRIKMYADWIDYPPDDRVLNGHSKGVKTAVVSYNGRLLFTGSDDCSIIVWDLANGYQQIKQWIAHSDSVSTLAYHRSGLLVSGCSNGNIRVWNAVDYALIHTLKGHTDTTMSIELNYKGTEIVSASKDKSLRLWSLDQAKCTVEFNGHDDKVKSVVWMDSPSSSSSGSYDSDSSSIIVSGSMDKSIRLWKKKKSSKKIEEGEELKCIRTVDIVSQICVNCDGSMIACLFHEGFSIYSWPEMDLIRTVDVKAHRGCFHPKISHLLAVSDFYDESINIVNVNGEETIPVGEHDEEISCVCFSPCGTLLISTGEDCTARIWNVSHLLNSK